MENAEIIKLWKEKGIQRANFKFSCGGDSMNETELSFYDDKGGEVSCGELESYFDSEVYNNVDFYVNSDGHYQGEFGDVCITLIEEEGDEEPYFNYSKSSESEWSETNSEYTFLELPEKIVSFVKDKVFNVNGANDRWREDNVRISYKQDCIITDEEEKLEKELISLLLERVDGFEPLNFDGELQDDDTYSFTTNREGEEITFDGNSIRLEVSYNVTIYRDE